jgi:hypothetical protein
MRHGLKLLISAFYLISILGGIWFGLFSCGGYVLHKQVMFWSLVAMAIMTMAILPFDKIWHRIALALGLFITFHICRALAAPFYISDFDSFSGYISQVLYALENGPC